MYSVHINNTSKPHRCIIQYLPKTFKVTKATRSSVIVSIELHFNCKSITHKYAKNNNIITRRYNVNF